MDRSLQARIRGSAEAEDGIEVIALDRVRALAREFGVSPREVELIALETRVLPRRYLRSLGTVGWEGQIKLLRSTVAVVGLGGLGGNVGSLSASSVLIWGVLQRSIAVLSALSDGLVSIASTR